MFCPELLASRRLCYLFHLLSNIQYLDRSGIEEVTKSHSVLDFSVLDP
jgi:hypothetical protein